MKIILYLSVLSILMNSCNNHTQSTPRQLSHEEIEAVTIHTFGGMLGHTSILNITKDSVLFKRNTATNPESDSSYCHRNTKENWADLTSKINLGDFAAAKDERSHQPYDGLDTEITVKTNRREISRTNANQNKTWQRLAEINSPY